MCSTVLYDYTHVIQVGYVININIWNAAYFFFTQTAKQCKSLKELNLSGVAVNTSSLKALSKSCTHLEVTS